MNPVMEALIDTLVALELASEALIDLDFEVGLMEHVARTLQGMTETQRTEFASTLARRAASTTDANRKKLMLELPEALGLADHR